MVARANESFYVDPAADSMALKSGSKIKRTLLRTYGAAIVAGKKANNQAKIHAKSSSTNEFNIQSSQFILKEKDGIKEFDLSLVLITVQQG